MRQTDLMHLLQVIMGSAPHGQGMCIATGPAQTQGVAPTKSGAVTRQQGPPLSLLVTVPPINMAITSSRSYSTSIERQEPCHSLRRGCHPP